MSGSAAPGMPGAMQLTAAVPSDGEVFEEPLDRPTIGRVNSHIRDRGSDTEQALFGARRGAG